MRLMITTIILTMLIQPLNAKTNIQLYKECKPYANNGFSIRGLNESHQFGAVACVAFQAGILHLAAEICQFGFYERDRQLFGTSIASTEILTQKFLNWAEANPEKWEYFTNPSDWLLGTCKEK